MKLYEVSSRIVLGNRHTAIKTLNKSLHKTEITFQIYIYTIHLYDDEIFLAVMSLAACTNAFFRGFYLFKKQNRKRNLAILKINALLKLKSSAIKQ